MLVNTITAKSSISDRLTWLKSSLKNMGTCAVAFSGGVDSTLLSVIAAEIMGEKALIVFAVSPVVSRKEIQSARGLASRHNFNYFEIECNQLALSGFIHNNKDRCYHCKMDMFQQFKAVSSLRGIGYICDGSNYNDLKDYRPGLKAIAEIGAYSPLAESFITKTEIRALAREKGLDNWDSPSSPCLASRVPYGIQITADILDSIEKGEAFLSSLGLKQVRLRHHGDIARIEVAESDVHLLTDTRNRDKTVAKLKTLGYKYIAVDLQGFRSGSLNEVL